MDTPPGANRRQGNMARAAGGQAMAASPFASTLHVTTSIVCCFCFHFFDQIKKLRKGGRGKKDERERSKGPWIDLHSCCSLAGSLACLLVSWTGFSQPHHHRLLLLPPTRQQLPLPCGAIQRFPGARKSCFQVKTRIRIADGLPVNLALISLPACLPACLARCKNKIRCRKDPWRACAIRQQKAGEREIVRGLGR